MAYSRDIQGDDHHQFTSTYLATSCNILQPCYLQGGLIGGAADFVQKICIEQFGIQDHITKK